MAKISVIVPVYNVEKYLKQCLDSIVNQTFDDLEIILVNDGSTDSSPQIMKEYAKKDSRIVIIEKLNGGYGSACNAGLNKATGEYVAIVEPDDFIEPNMYQELYEYTRDGMVDIVKSCFYIFYDIEKFQKDVKEYWSGRFELPKEGEIFNIYQHPEFLSFHPSIWSALYRRDFINENNIRFIEAPGSAWTDNPFRVVTCLRAKTIVFTNEAYYHWRNQHWDFADALKDITIPYKRFAEINQWLKENNITDTNILANLYKINLGYTETLMRKITFLNYNQVKREVLKFLGDIDENILRTNNYFSRMEYNKYCKLKDGIGKYYIKSIILEHLYLLRVLLMYIKLYFKIHTTKNLMFWGASLFLIKFLKFFRIKTKNIIGIVDKNPARWGENIFGYIVYPPESINDLKAKNLIMSIKHHSEDRYDDVKSFVEENCPEVNLLPNIFAQERIL